MQGPIAESIDFSGNSILWKRKKNTFPCWALIDFDRQLHVALLYGNRSSHNIYVHFVLLVLCVVSKIIGKKIAYYW